LNNAKHGIDAVTQKTVEISQQEVEVLTKDRQHLEQVSPFSSQTKDLFV